MTGGVGWAEITSGSLDGEWTAPDNEATVAEASSGAASSIPQLTGRDLEDVDAFADLPEELHEALASAARVEDLAANEEVSGFGATLVLFNDAMVCSAIVDTPAARASAGTLVPSRGTLAEGIPLRVVAGARGTLVAVWDQATIDDALRACPWVVDELREAADQLQAYCGATIGPLGDLEEELLPSVLEQLSLRHLQPEESVVMSGHPMPGLMVVGGGSVELVEEAEGAVNVVGTLRPGDLVFADALLTGQPAPRTARAAASGALVLLGEHPVLRELFEAAPSLISVLSEDA